MNPTTHDRAVPRADAASMQTACDPALDTFVRVLLDRAATPAELDACCDGFYVACAAVTDALSEQRTVLDCGLALSAQDAARCVLDFARTAAYVRALDAVIVERLSRGAPVRVLYAGCGPFATLALPLAARYPAASVQFCLIDVHPESLHAARTLFAHNGLDDRLATTICADASRLQLPQMPPQDVLVVEVMQRALEHEPQLAVVANLLPQCAHDADLVPQRVVVSAELGRAESDARGDHGRVRIDLGALLELSRERLPALRAAMGTAAPTRIDLPPLRLPDELDSGLALMLTTRIEASASDVLVDYASGLTCPRFLFELSPLRAGEWLEVAYRLGRDPGFALRR